MIEPTIKIKMQDFREVLPFADAHINETWIRGYDWMVHVSKVLTVPKTYYQGLSDKSVQRVLDAITDIFLTVQLTTQVTYISDRVQPHIRHKLALFQGDDGPDRYVRDRYVDTFGLRELRCNPKLMWTPDEMFFTQEVTNDCV